MVRRRLELLLAAIHGRSITIRSAEPAASPGVRGRVGAAMRRWFTQGSGLASSDGASIRLPPDVRGDAPESAIASYRLLALEQGARVARGTSMTLAEATDPLVRDLFLLREAALVDAAIARDFAPAAPAIADARAHSLVRRPELHTLPPTERAVEELLRRTLAADPATFPAELGEGSTPQDSLRWARAAAGRLRSPEGWYRAIDPVAIWGKVESPRIAARPLDGGRGPGDDEPGDDEKRDDIPDDPRRREPARQGAETALTRDIENAEQLIENDAGTPVAMPDPAGALDEDDLVSRPVAADDLPRTAAVAHYDEWDHERGAYRPRATTIRQYEPPQGEGAWASAVLAERAAVVRRIRKQFERLRARRLRLDRQRDGEELDLTACVRAFADTRAGNAADDRLYVSVRPARRPIAIMLLVDTSGSTDAPVAPGVMIIDVEKIALLLASEALEALGDRYMVASFAGIGPDDVRMTTVKSFDERHGDTVRRRIAGLSPRGNTRLGAAIRHASSLLTTQPVGHRLLLLLSDGRPNDIGVYHEEYGVEDSRQAINEARASGVHPFCLTVDREGAEYLPRIFGPAHVVLRDPEHLPEALLAVVRGLIGH